jgi:putative ABC transport system permease protein
LFLGPLLSNNLGRALPVHMLRIFIILAFLVIVSSVFNYNNLSLARSLGRAKEVGIRKVNGAGRLQLVHQFLVEAVLTTMISLVIAYVLLHIILIPAF